MCVGKHGSLGICVQETWYLEKYSRFHMHLKIAYCITVCTKTLREWFMQSFSTNYNAICNFWTQVKSAVYHCDTTMQRKPLRGRYDQIETFRCQQRWMEHKGEHWPASPWRIHCMYCGMPHKAPLRLKRHRTVKTSWCCTTSKKLGTMQLQLPHQ